MSFTLYGNALSTCTARVLVCVEQMGIADKVRLNSVEFPTVSTAEWKVKQPFGQMPYLVDESNGFTVFESRAICKYLAAKAGATTLAPPPSNPEAYGLFEQACSVESSNFDPAASGLAYELVFAERKGFKSDPERAEKHKGLLAKRLEGYEAILSKQKFLAGDHLTLADLFHLPYGVMAEQLKVAPGLTDGSLPAVGRWWKEITSLQSWTNTQAQRT